MTNEITPAELAAMESAEIKPCPFCEATGCGIDTIDEGDGYRTYCLRCGSSTNTFPDDADRSERIWDTRPTESKLLRAYKAVKQERDRLKGKWSIPKLRRIRDELRAVLCAPDGFASIHGPQADNDTITEMMFALSDIVEALEQPDE